MPDPSSPDPDPPPADDGNGGARWAAVVLVSLAYLATTTGEALLAPVYPLAGDELGLDLTGAGLAFAALALAIAVSTVAGGLLVRVLPVGRVLTMALAVSAAGAAVAAGSSSGGTFLAAQVLLGGGAGLLYPAAVLSIGALAGPGRRGRAMGVFGVFFSGGLALAAALAAVGGRDAWRIAFVAACGLALAAAIVIARFLDVPPAATAGPVFGGLRAVLGVPTVVGTVGGVSQYATVSFLPAFAVEAWGSSGAVAAALLLVARLLSVPAKLLSGAASDRFGPLRTASAIGVVLAVAGLIWTVGPWPTLAAAAAVLFAAEVSALFPLANVLAVERVGNQGPALGAFRAVQLGMGALAGFGIGTVAGRVGLQATLAVVAIAPILLVVVGLLAERPGGEAC